ncbi:MAG: oxidoreductase [Spongiibacteraceae bacterium]|nr:oxidoreductase [Spongiibacteraceae bacterium]|tara:strand:- start:1170 stop:1985 length:816 start_codon:yes stop_codon:yes gene_type:complete
MKKTLLITGSTDGIGLETAKALLKSGHRVLMHGRNREKLHAINEYLTDLGYASQTTFFLADLSELADVYRLASDVIAHVDNIDVLINNAGIFKTPNTVASNGIDVRFMVNTVAPWVLTRELRPVFADDARLINLSSAAQAPVDLPAMRGETRIADDFNAYAQSKLALTMWTMDPSAIELLPTQAIVAVNPGSMLGSKMVKEGFGTSGKDISIGARILQQLALYPDAVKSFQYFDNDVGKYSKPHPDALSPIKRNRVLSLLSLLGEIQASDA